MLDKPGVVGRGGKARDLRVVCMVRGGGRGGGLGGALRVSRGEGDWVGNRSESQPSEFVRCIIEAI